MSIVLLFSIAVRPAVAQTVDITGKWNVAVTTQWGTGTSTLRLEQKGDKLTGRYEGSYGKADLSGTVKGKVFTFTFTLDLKGEPQKFIYEGTAEQNLLKGKVTLPGVVAGTFSAKRE
jgi:hypothetical protein